jgi:pimeloyl-ACP methyl ester carboxylesterase
MLIHIEPGVRLFVDIEGAGLVPQGASMREKPTPVLLHGGPGYDHSGFKPAFSRLADVAQIVYFDHRGHGRSDRRPPSEWTLDTFADDVVRLCDALGVTNPIVLGQSFGGFVAQRYLARHPAHAGKVILSSTSPQLGLARKLAMFDPVCPLADSQDIAAALPPALVQLVVFGRSGHGAWRDEPEAAFARLREFIAQ